MFGLESFSSSFVAFSKKSKSGPEMFFFKNLFKTNCIILFLATNEFILGKSDVCLAKTKSPEDHCNTSKAARIKTTFRSGRPAEKIKSGSLKAYEISRKHFKFLA